MFPQMPFQSWLNQHGMFEYVKKQSFVLGILYTQSLFFSSREVKTKKFHLSSFSKAA